MRIDRRSKLNKVPLERNINEAFLKHIVAWCIALNSSSCSLLFFAQRFLTQQEKNLLAIPP